MGASLFVPGRNKYNITHLSYLGMGSILLACSAFGLFAVALVKKEKRYLTKENVVYMVCALIAMLISVFFALSPVGRWGDKIIYEIPLNDTFYKLWSTVRSSYRLAWSVVYGVNLAAVWTVSKARFKWKNAMVIACALIQAVDMVPMINRQHTNFSTEVHYESPLVSSAWDTLSYKDKIVFMNGDCRNNAMTLIQMIERPAIYGFAQYAFENDMEMNDFYYSRKDSLKMNEARTAIWNDLYKGKVDENAIYIFLEMPARLIYRNQLNFYWADGYFIGVTDELKETADIEKYDCTGPVSVLPESSEKSLLYAEKAECDGQGGRIIFPEGKSFGPQISLDAGKYKISMVGKNLSDADFRCVATDETDVSMENLQVTDALVEYEVQFDTAVEKLEFVVENHSAEEIGLQDITLLKYSE